MKLQFGLLHLDGRPACRQRDWSLFVDGAVAAEIAGEVIEGPALIGYRGQTLTEEDDFDCQPVRCGPYILTFDGRLDNRKEIAARVAIPHLESVPDSQIVMKAYKRFGDSIFAGLIGEFALTLFCVLDRSLRFVRSACGARTLYYTQHKNTLFWSSDFPLLVKASGVDLTINDDYIVKFLVWHPSGRETPLKNFGAVPPNHILHFRSDHVTKSTEMWDPTRISPAACKTDAEYEEEFRVNIKEAIAARLRAKHRVFAELSGGLDSSSVVLLGDAILRERGISPLKLQTISCVYETSTTCDERRFIEIAAQHRGVATHFVSEKDQRIATGLEDTRFTGLPNPLHCFPGRYETIQKVMRTHDARVLLTGLGGDHLFWSDADGAAIVADELSRGSLLQAHAECRAWSRWTNTPYYELLFQRAVPLALHNMKGNKALFKEPEIPSWLHPSQKARFSSPTPEFGRFENWKAMPSTRSQVFVLDHMFRMTGAAFFAEYKHIYVSHPYSHRRLVEFCLGTPIGQFLRISETRSLMRRALREQLPRQIVTRTSKGLVDEAIVRSIREEWPHDISAWQVCQREYASSSALSESIRQARLGIQNHSGTFARLFSLERWLCSLKSSSTGLTQFGDARVPVSRASVVVSGPSKWPPHFDGLV